MTDMTRITAETALEIIQELREELGLEKGESLRAAVRKMHEEVLVARGMKVAREVIARNAPNGA